MFVFIAVVALYGSNAGRDKEIMSAFNLLWAIVIFIGAKSFYVGMKWTIQALKMKGSGMAVK
jgi:hypothetical protein